MRQILGGRFNARQFRHFLGILGLVLASSIPVLYIALFAKASDISDTKRLSVASVVTVALLVVSSIIIAVAQFRAEMPDRGQLARARFYTLYTDSLAAAIGTLSDLEDADEQDILVALTGTLTLVTAVVASYQGNTKASINANIMVHEATSCLVAAKFHDAVTFTDRRIQPDAYRCILRIIAWDKQAADVPPDFCLPVDGDPDQVLFGAPRTFLTRHVEHHRYTRQIRSTDALLQHQPKQVKDAITSYFKKAKFKSFVSIPIDSGNKDVAVLSIQSTETEVFGYDKAEEQDMLQCVVPFRAILAYILREYERVQRTGAPYVEQETGTTRNGQTGAISRRTRTSTRVHGNRD